ncbi:MAG: thermonuclease family protein [Candidatus Omnitrophica bacterium]|nr:thermonuclease family protein [Candidatus Omnitrophota bacterium]
MNIQIKIRNPFVIPSALLFVFIFAHAGYGAPEITQPVIAGSGSQEWNQAISKLDVKTYPQLLHAIRDVRSASQKRVEQAVDREKVREAWETGKLINEHILLNKTRAQYGERVIHRLSEDMGIGDSELNSMREFAKAYPIDFPGGQLSWSHYKALLTVNDDKIREQIAVRAEKKKWSRETLRKELRKRQSRAAKKESKPVELSAVKPGKPFHYRVVRAAEGPYKGDLALDLGFFNYYKPNNLGVFKEEDILSIECEEHACIMKSVEENEDVLYTYNAHLIRVIDGDTIEAVIDLGFDFTTVHQLRLRSLDAPEILSSDGKSAKQLIAQILARDQGRILIKTKKSEDQYGRYLADIFLPSSLRGPKGRGNPEYVSINQELLDSGLLTVREGE